MGNELLSSVHRGLMRRRRGADNGRMEYGNHEMSPVSEYSEADSRVVVAERGLVSWRAAKAAWLDSFAVFAAQEALAESGAHSWSNARVRRNAPALVSTRRS